MACQTGSCHRQEDPPCGPDVPQRQYESIPCHNDADCGLCMEPLRRARCVPINYVQKVCPIIPHQTSHGSNIQMDALSTYRAYYVPKNAQKRESFRPKLVAAKNCGKLDGPSEYNYAYVPYKVAPYEKPPWSKKEEFKGVEGYINGVSTYRASFQPSCGKPATLMRPSHHYDPNREPFDDLTTYRTQFIPYCHEKVCPIKPESIYGSGGDVPFVGNTMYRVSYNPPCRSEKIQSYKPKSHFRKLDDCFEDETTYSRSYLPFAFQQCTPAEKKDCYTYKDMKL